MRGAEEESPVLFPLTHSSTGLQNQVLRRVGADVPYQAFEAVAIERSISSLVLRNAYHCILIPFPKDHRDVSTWELGEKTAYINHSGRRIQSSWVVQLEKKKPKHFWPQLQALASHVPHQAGQVWEAEPQTLELCFN